MEYKSLADLLNGETPQNFGISLYKYTDCGPWTVFVTADGKDVYYETAPERIKNCIGIKIGSIVEGSDEGIDPVTLLFPFTSEQLDNTVRQINDDASQVWEWANVTYDKMGRKHRYGKTMAEMGTDWPLL